MFFENVLPTETLQTQTESDKGQNKGQFLGSQGSTGRKEVEKITQLQTYAAIHEKKKDDYQGRAVSLKSGGADHIGSFPGHENQRSLPSQIKIIFGVNDSHLLFIFPLFKWEYLSL